MRSLDDLVQIAAAGGGLLLDAAHWSVEELVAIAAAAAQGEANVVLKNTLKLSADDLVRIGAAPRGSVLFEDV